jgi:hypothetical protein
MGMVKSTFFKLLTRAPRTVIASSVMFIADAGEHEKQFRLPAKHT